MATQTRNISIVTQQDIQPGREGETEVVISYAGKEYPTGIKAATPEEAVVVFVKALGQMAVPAKIVAASKPK